MLTRKLPLIFLLGVALVQTTNAQLFETRSTRYAKVDILQKLIASGHQEQIDVRDSVIQLYADSLMVRDTLETYFDDYHLGLVVFREGKPFELLGFWDPHGSPVDGGKLSNGSGTVRTPFNPELIANFKNESVVYEYGMKNGPVFYYCDCASVLRRGTFNNNQKEGLWKEYKPTGEFIKQKRIKIEKDELEEAKLPDDKRWLEPAHCMMRNPDEIHIKCPND